MLCNVGYHCCSANSAYIANRQAVIIIQGRTSAIVITCSSTDDSGSSTMSKTITGRLILMNQVYSHASPHYGRDSAPHRRVVLHVALLESTYVYSDTPVESHLQRCVSSSSSGFGGLGHPRQSPALPQSRSSCSTIAPFLPSYVGLPGHTILCLFRNL